METQTLYPPTVGLIATPGGRQSETLRSPGSSELMPVLRPRLPSSTELLKYLQIIDQRRWYSNYGPVVTRLEEVLSGHLGLSRPGVVTVANATVGITAALLARKAPEGEVCVMPSWTFAATPHAALGAGLTPWFHDVDRRTWALHPDAVADTIKDIPHRVGAVVVVSPFGAPIDIEKWQAFEDRTGVPVVVDAAAGFDTVRPVRIPCVVSLHATKILGAGEGGFVVTSESVLWERIRACCNFGFQGARSALFPALNAKMSEYHAAVALASFNSWQSTRSHHARICGWYRQGIARVPGVALQPRYGQGWVCSTTSIVLPPGELEQTARRLVQLGIETRGWWGAGCHVQPAFADCPRGPLPVTEELGSRVLGLPHFPDMQRSEVDTVVRSLAEALGTKPLQRRLTA